jgi:hypothetical protein
MMEQIRGRRIAAELTRKRRTPRRIAAASPGGTLGTALLFAARALSRTAREKQKMRMKESKNRGAPLGLMSRGEGGGTMRRVVGVGLVAAGIGIARWFASRQQPSPTRERPSKNRWEMVTINCSTQRLASRADLPEPIARLGDKVDIKICPAPGDRGTELGARLREPVTGLSGVAARITGEDPRSSVRRALREAKSIIETGEVVRRDWPPTTRPTPTAKIMEFAHRRGGGRL